MFNSAAASRVVRIYAKEPRRPANIAARSSADWVGSKERARCKHRKNVPKKTERDARKGLKLKTTMRQFINDIADCRLTNRPPLVLHPCALFVVRFRSHRYRRVRWKKELATIAVSKHRYFFDVVKQKRLRSCVKASLRKGEARARSTHAVVQATSCDTTFSRYEKLEF